MIVQKCSVLWIAFVPVSQVYSSYYSKRHVNKINKGPNGNNQILSFSVLPRLSNHGAKGPLAMKKVGPFPNSTGP